jgi:hypothetical protein
MAKAKRVGWAIYVVGFLIWLFGYLSPGHAAAFDWDVAAPSWISSFVPNLEAEFGLALMFASMIPIYWRAGRKRGPSSAGGDGDREPSDICKTGMISRRAGLISNVRSYLARLFVFAALLVFGAVTLAWWGFLAWLIWHVI